MDVNFSRTRQTSRWLSGHDRETRGWAEAREKHERGLPGYVEKELREYLKCGILAHGFLRTM